MIVPRHWAARPWLAAVLACALGLPWAPAIQPSAALARADVPDLAALVDPFLGTGSAHPSYGIGNEGGHVFPGAAYPAGMVQWSPDTTQAAGGYRYEQLVVHGFSLTHFSGRGCSSYQDAPFLPLPGDSAAPLPALAAGVRYAHAGESATPGFYAIRLRNGVGVALTVTARTGMGRFTFPGNGAGTLLINTGGSATGDDPVGTGVQIVSNNLVTGSAASGRFCGENHYQVFFAAQFDHPFSAFGVWNGDRVETGGRSVTGARSGAYLRFAPSGNHTIQVKVGLSFVSVANAQANLAAANPGWNFARAAAAARAAWNAALGQIAISGGTSAQRTMFYTALYHTLIHPNLFSDANGEYRGFDGRVHQASGYDQYENLTGWDTYRSLIPLRAMLHPAQAGAMVESLLADAAQGGGGLPRWEVANDNSGGLVGDSQDVVIADAFAFGAGGFDPQAALETMETGASVPGIRSGRYPVRDGLATYLAHGYVDQAASADSASATLEYATDDFAISRMAAALGRADDAQRYLARSTNWRTLFDPAVGAIVPRDANGAFLPYDPTGKTGFLEGDSAQYTWMVPFDLRGLFQAMGGNAVAERRLDAHFQQLNAGPASMYAFMSNEPELIVPWEYDFAGAPSRTQVLVHRIATQLFGVGPNGLPGNDDSGALSAWLVWADLGLYPAIPGVAGFAVGSPLFPQAVIHLPSGDLRIVANGAATNAPYVHRLTLNGTMIGGPWLPYSALRRGGTLDFTLSSTADPAWGTSSGTAPPSFAP